MNMMKYALIGTAGILFSGCAGLSTNPAEGGLFSYNPKAYEARQQERSNQVQQLQAERLQYEKDAVKLQKERDRQSAAVSRQEKQLKAVKSELAALSSSITALKKGTDEQRSRALVLEKEHHRLQRSLADADKETDVQARREKIRRLQSELKTLEQEAEVLSNL